MKRDSFSHRCFGWLLCMMLIFSVAAAPIPNLHDATIVDGDNAKIGDIVAEGVRTENYCKIDSFTVNQSAGVDGKTFLASSKL